MNYFNKYPKETIQAIKESKTLSDVFKCLNISDNGGNRRSLKRFISINNIDISHFKRKLTKDIYEQNPKLCKYCGNIIPWEKRENEFCNQSCSASYNNQNNCKTEKFYCLNCGKEITKGKKYCNNKCESDYEHKQYINNWKQGSESGIIGKDDVSNHIRRYLFDKYDNSCQCCGWKQINPYTNKVPLQIHHIDGDCTNNSESNLQLLCPNCHSLTENFGSRNNNCTRIDKRQR